MIDKRSNFIQELIESHNAKRLVHGARRLRSSKKLNESAQEWATQLLSSATYDFALSDDFGMSGFKNCNSMVQVSQSPGNSNQTLTQRVFHQDNQLLRIGTKKNKTTTMIATTTVKEQVTLVNFYGRRPNLLASGLIGIKTEKLLSSLDTNRPETKQDSSRKMYHRFLWQAHFQTTLQLNQKMTMQVNPLRFI